MRILHWYVDTIIEPFYGYKVYFAFPHFGILHEFVGFSFSGIHCIGIPLPPMTDPDPDKFT